MFRSLTSLTLVISSASALAFLGPRPTSAAELGDLVFPPEPTTGPMLYHDLLKRAVYTDLIAPDNTCGYISGLPGAAYTCNPSTDLCAFFPGKSKTAGAVGCCDSNFNCGARVTCVDRQAYLSSNVCDNGCVKDTFTLKCTASTAPYCNGITFPNENVQDYFCDNTLVKTWQTAATTFNNYQGNRIFSSVTVSDTPSGTTAKSTTVDGQTTTTGPAQATTTDAGGAAATIPATATSASGSATPVAVSSGSSTPVGPIVGGVVGGVGGIALISAAIFFFLRSRSKKNNTAAGGTAPVAPPTYASPQDSNSTAYAAAAAGKPAATPHESPMTGYAPTQNHQYQPVPQQYPPDMQQQPVQQQYPPDMQQQPPQKYPLDNQVQQQYPLEQQRGYPQMAEVEGNNYQQPPQNLTAGYGQHPSQSPAQTYYTPSASGQISPNSQAHLSTAFPDRNDTTSPLSDRRVSRAAMSEAPSSPAPTFVSHAPAAQALAPVVEGRHEMSANLAGPFPSNLHDGTYEVPGSVPHHP